MILTVHCKVCQKTWDYEVEPGQTFYGAAYVIGAHHEAESRNSGCMFNAVRHIVLISARGLEQGK